MPNSSRRPGDPMPVIGGGTMAADLIDDLNDDFVASNDAFPDDPLAQRAYDLLTLNADQLSLRFRNSDLAKMDDDTKRLLIQDLCDSLEIKPLRSDTL
ncbi:hypothetical protein [Rosistilla oblonga]|uniref:Uncharacterized protein n=1 Tax=Rosistilla oblonga TaxID=2527990 RepID=A0A518IUW4_9BACT|nr:hypothetical protein [Rosistilla oblonga]QDV56878.1 hypothetical protein Mal33_28790 [Rosistilla oblonga]